MKTTEEEVLEFAAKRATTLESLRAKRFAQIKERALRRVPCAACDRGDFQLGHADGCKSNADVLAPAGEKTPNP